MKTTKNAIAAKIAAAACALTLAASPATALATTIPAPIPAPIPEIALFVPAPLDSECLRALAIVLDDAGLCADEVSGVRTATYEGYPYPEGVVDVEFDAYGRHYCYLVGADSDCILEAYVY